MIVYGDLELSLRVQFNIDKEMTENGAGKCEVKIFNPSKEHLAEFESDTGEKLLTVYAGYDGINKMLFTGKVLFAITEQSGPDIIVTCQMVPGQKALTGTYLKVENATTDGQILQAVLNSLRTAGGVVKGHISSAVMAALDAGKHSGFSDIGTTAKFLNLITKRHKLRWAIHNNELNIYSAGEYEAPEMIQVDAESGMIGIPSKTQTNQYKVRTLLNGDIVPGRRIRVESKVHPLKGDLKVIKVTHVGDTLEGDWYSDAEGLIIGKEPGFVLVNQ